MKENFLTVMASSSFRRYQQSSEVLSEHDLLESIKKMEAIEPIVLSKTDFHFITEIKKKSPSMGPLSEKSFDIKAQAEQYTKGGASLISVLTEPTQFSGSLEDLNAISQMRLDTPLMRKDFLVHPYQVSEARYYGAHGVLLIVGMLNDDQLEKMILRCLEHKMFAILEVFNQLELERANNRIKKTDGVIDSLLLGVNCRNLKSLTVDFANFEKLANDLPKNTICVAESGIYGSNDIKKVIKMGYRAALIGTSLMQSADPQATLQKMKAAASKHLK